MNRVRIIGGVAALILIFPLLVVLFIPATQLQSVLQSALAREGYTFTAGRFGKAFPLGISAKDVRISDARGELLRLDRLTVRLGLLRLLTGTPSLSADAAVDSGTISASWRGGRSGGIDLEISGLRLEQVPFFRTVTGAAIKGIFKGEARLTGAAPRLSGVIKLAIKGAELADLKLGEMPLPAVTDETVQGLIRVKDGRGKVESLTFEGTGLYARLSGDVPLAAAAPLDLTLELMPKADFLEKQKFVFLLLVKFLDSPGHYRIPIRGTLAKPAVF